MTRPDEAVPLTGLQLAYLANYLGRPETDRTSYCIMTWDVVGRPVLSALEKAVDVVHRTA